MDTVVVTVQSSLLQRFVDLELPGEVPLQALLPALVNALQLPFAGSAGQPIAYQLYRQPQRSPLPASETLLSAGVVTGDVLALVQIGAEPGGVSRVQRGSSSALLRSDSGTMIALDNYGKAELTVGRYDAGTGKSPDIDLSEEPDGSTVSRSHALLRKQGNRWMLIPVSTMNATWVGNARLTPQQPWPLKPGDVIVFGAVKLVFETGHQ